MPEITVELLKELNPLDLMDICDATESTMLDTHGFSVGFKQWKPPLRQDIEAYFKGVMLIPERKMFVGRIDGTIAGSLQLLLPYSTDQVSSFLVRLDNHFVVPWGRNLGLSKKLLTTAEDFARRGGYSLIKLSVRSDREAAINLYEKFGYKRWGVLDKYEKVGNRIFSGYFYSKDL